MAAACGRERWNSIITLTGVSVLLVLLVHQGACAWT